MPVDSEALATLTGANHVIRVGGRGRFETYLRGLSPAFQVQPGGAYLISVPAARAVTLPTGP